MKMTKRERERVLTIIETAVVVLLALVAAWRFDIDIDKIAAISADQWILIATGVSGAVVAVRNAWRESVRPAAPIRVPVERETPVEPRRPEEGMAHPETLAWILFYALGAGIAFSHALSRYGALLVAFMMGAGLLCGCTTARDVARVTVYGASEALVVVDRVEAIEYANAHRRALEAATTAIEYAALMQPHNDIEDALRAAREALLAADAIVDTWDHGGEGRWLAAAGCVASALAHVVAMLEAAHVAIPPELQQVLASTATIGSAVCEGGA